MSSKNKRLACPEPEAPSPPPAGSHRYHFPGHAHFVRAAMDRSGLPPRILQRVTASVPIGYLGRFLAGLAEMSQRHRSRPLWPAEIALVKAGLLDVDEIRWHYRVGAIACLDAIEEARRAFALDATEPAADDDEPPVDDAPPPPWTFVGIDPYFSAEGRRLGLSVVFSKRGYQTPEVHRIASRLGDVFSLYRRSPKHAGRPALTGIERGTVLADLANASEESMIISVLAEASEEMLAGAYAGFGLEMPATPAPDMPECRGCAPILNSQQRTRAKVVPYFA